MTNSTQPTANASPVADGANVAVKLLRAGALAAVLVPLGSIAVDAETITCVTSANEGVCSDFGSGTTFDSQNGTHIWKFFANIDDTQPLYTLEIAAVTPLTDEESFNLTVRDRIVSPDTQLSTEFPEAVCIPMFQILDEPASCTIFDVEVVLGTVPEAFLYDMTMTWFSNDHPLSQPLTSATNRILKSEAGDNFDEALLLPFYEPEPVPGDPALGGRGSTFSGFVGTTTVPEPGAMLLFGTAAAAALIRRRRRQ